MDKKTYEALKRIMEVVYDIAGKDINKFTDADVEQVEAWIDKNEAYCHKCQKRDVGLTEHDDGKEYCDSCWKYLSM